MMYQRNRAARCGVAVLASLLALTGRGEAQRKQPLEFTQQGVLVANFWVVGDRQTPSTVRNDLQFGRRVGDAVRDRLGRLVNKREARIIPSREIRESLIRSAYSADTTLSLDELRQQGDIFRTDEILMGRATRLANGGLRVDAQLILWRDPRLRQPIPAVSAIDFERAVDQLAARIHESRTQLRYQRRCENSLRMGQGAQAVRSAREGIAAYPGGALVRTCLVWALRAIGAPATDVLTEARAILNIDAGAPHALEAAAVSLDLLKHREEAADMWLRLAATDASNLELTERVVWSMAEGGNSRPAEPLIVRVSDQYPDNLRLVRQKWRVANDNRSWPLAITAGEKLLASDPDAARDSVFFLRLATAYRANLQTFKAVETVARGVSSFPHDARLYALYTQTTTRVAPSP